MLSSVFNIESFISNSVSDYYGYGLDDNSLSITLGNIGARSKSERTSSYVNRLLTVSDDIIVWFF